MQPIAEQIRWVPLSDIRETDAPDFPWACR